MGADRSTPVEADRLRWAFPLALIVALVRGWLAPADWSAGPADLEVRYLGELAVSTPIELGSGDPVVSTARVGGATFAVLHPTGSSWADRSMSMSRWKTRVGKPAR